MTAEVLGDLNAPSVGTVPLVGESPSRLDAAAQTRDLPSMVLNKRVANKSTVGELGKGG